MSRRRLPSWTDLASALRREWPLLVVAIAAAAVLLVGLGNNYLWEDEGDTAVLARGILQHGVPVAWDGVSLTVPDFGQRLNDDLVMMSHPWLQYYLVAASFAVFGQDTFAARLPFALAGFGTIVVVYLMTLKLVGSRLVAGSAASLLLLNVQFLVFSRQARGYSVHALLTCLLVWQFLNLRSRTQAVVFGVLGILLFHAHPIGLVTLAVLGALSLLVPMFREHWRWFWPPAAVIVVYATPWLLVSRAGYAENATLIRDAGRFLPRLLQFAIEWASVAPAIGIALLLAFVLIRRRPRPEPTRKRRGREVGPPVFEPGERALLIVWAALAIGYAAATALTQTRDIIWIVGVRQVAAIIPLSLMAAGVLIGKASRGDRRVWIALMIVFGFTKLARITPWTFWADPEPLREPDALVAFHQPVRPLDRLLRAAQVRFLWSLGRENTGVVGAISGFLSENADPGDIVITNYAWEAIYFHTGLPQGMKVSSALPVYATAKERGLPDYVFGMRGVRWIVWRRVWAPLWGQDCEKILADLSRAGVPVHLAASIRETLYENRPNLHFRRFAGDEYTYPWFPDLPDALIYRVDWPET